DGALNEQAFMLQGILADPYIQAITNGHPELFVGEGSFPWHPGRRARLAEARQIGDVVLLRYALSDRCPGD
ncbi:deaminase, partial [Micromonospora sp. NPDC005113]